MVWGEEGEDEWEYNGGCELVQGTPHVYGTMYAACHNEIPNVLLICNKSKKIKNFKTKVVWEL